MSNVFYPTRYLTVSVCRPFVRHSLTNSFIAALKLRKISFTIGRESAAQYNIFFFVYPGIVLSSKSSELEFVEYLTRFVLEIQAVSSILTFCYDNLLFYIETVNDKEINVHRPSPQVQNTFFVCTELLSEFWCSSHVTAKIPQNCFLPFLLCATLFVT